MTWVTITTGVAVVSGVSAMVYLAAVDSVLPLGVIYCINWELNSSEMRGIGHRDPLYNLFISWGVVGEVISLFVFDVGLMVIIFIIFQYDYLIIITTETKN